MGVASYRDLRVWQEGVRLSLDNYRLTAAFPDNEKFSLISQLRRCAISIPSNIAEGHARLSTKEYIRHVSIALGSLAELETQLHISRELKYANPVTIDDLLSTADILGKQLRSLTRSLKGRVQ